MAVEVTRTNGVANSARHPKATGYRIVIGGGLEVREADRTVATYAPGHWASVQIVDGD